MPDAGRPWVVMLSGSPWQVAAHRQQALARELARDVADGFRVLFVDPPSNAPRWRFAVDQLERGLWRATVPSILPLGRQLPPVNRLARRVAATRLRRWLDHHPGDRLLWLDEDLAAPMAGRLGESAVVYDATDLDWTFTRPWNRWHLRRALRAAVGAADLVLASSSALPGELPTRSPDDVVVVPNACDPSMFRPDGGRWPAIAELDPPVLGYLGAVDERAFDGALVAAVARAHPEWTFALVGPSTPAGRAPLAGLANVHLHAPVAFADAPAVVRSFDVGLIPYRVGGLVDYVHPKKAYEYLAAGTPVVATPLPALTDLADGAGAIVVADGAEAFAAAIIDALARSRSPRDVEARRSVAEANTWQVRGDQVRQLLGELLGELVG